MDLPIKLTPQEVEIVLQGLGELPLKVSANVFFRVRQQRDEAMKGDQDVPKLRAVDAQKGD